jgi:hypothetical protein
MNRLFDDVFRGFDLAPFGMKIAQIAPLAERVPPRLYGGTEELVRARVM